MEAMKAVFWIAGVVGLLVVLFAVIGRFHGPATVTVLGRLFEAKSLLLVGNTILLVGLYFGLLGKPK